MESLISKRIIVTFRNNVKRAINMYRNGLIDFKTLDKKWIEPRAYGRYGKDWNDVILLYFKLQNKILD